MVFGVHAYKMLKNIQSIDMVSLSSYSVHATQRDVCVCFAEFSIFQRSKMI